MATRGRGTPKPNPGKHKKDAMTSKPSQNKRTFRSKQDPSGTGAWTGDSFDQDLKRSHNRATPRQVDKAADKDFPSKRLPVSRKENSQRASKKK